MAHNPVTQILLTRPAEQSTAYKATLEAEFGQRVIVIESSLLEIKPVKSKLDLHGIRYLLFTSVNGVNAFINLSSMRDIPALCVGARTAEKARAAGISAQSADGTAADLITLAQSVTGPFLYPRGVHVAQDIATDIREYGQQVDEVIAYDQQPLNLTQQAISTLTDNACCLVPLFSPRSAALFHKACAGLELRRVHVICLSRNVAAKIEPAQFENLTITSEPTAAAVTREIAASL